MAGLPASGKSAIARELKLVLNAVLLDKDQVRASLFSDYVDYSRAQDDLCVSIMYDIAHYHLEHRGDTPVVLDGRTYSRGYQVEAVKHAADRAATTLCFIECVCSPATAKERLERDRGVHLAADRDYKLYQKSYAASEPIVEPRLTLNTDTYSESQCVEIALEYIRVQRS